MHGRRTHSQSRGFTIVELLVVVAIIAVLIAIAVTVGGRVVASGKGRQTTESIRVLETMLNEYQASQQVSPALTVNHPDPKASAQTIVIADAVSSTAQPTDKPFDTVAWFLVQMQDSSSAAGMVKSLGKALQPSYRDATGKPQSYIDKIADGTPFNTVLDAWGRPIRYVHPAADGVYDRAVYNAGQPLNSVLDRAAPGSRTYAPAAGNLVRTTDKAKVASVDLLSDGGRCVGKAAYFYSCGPDGDPSTTADNVYSVVPTFASN
jgi:prepilin-type N-terminal cleavage/methylation domain-containing protein